MDQALIPGATLVISLLSLAYTEWQSRKAKDREQQIDDRAAAKDTVDRLVSMNEVLGRQIADLEHRLERMEVQFADCLSERTALILERDALLARLKNATE